MDVSLNSDVLDQLNTTEAKALHDISDSLSACGVGKIVNLPQIIVVGEQSAGKSSVLEAISHVRFPVEGNLCTRFATELVLRQANETRIDVSVKFEDKLKAPKSFQRTGFREDDLGDIIKEAKECMGFARAGKEFSKDVLRLEIEGPRMYPLSLVDLPGFFHTDTENQSLGGKDTVDELVESYMRQTNSIILVVVTANNNLANHVALHKVKNADPQRQRTIGDITKPDLTRAGGADERTYVRVAKNQEGAHKLQLGWHVLRNRAENKKSLETRDEIEESFFQSGAWAIIPREDRGISNLHDESRKFRAQLRNFSRAFDHVHRSKGSTQVIVPDDGSEPKEDDIPGYLAEFLKRYPYDFPDPEIITADELCTQLEKQAAVNQGREFPGSPNKDLAVQLFKKQAAPWKAIAEYHVSLVTTVAKAFVDQVFKYAVGSSHTPQTTEVILSACVDPFFDEKETVLQAKVDELLEPYAQGYALPLDIEFYQSLSQRSTDRLASRFCELMQENYPQMFHDDSTKKVTPKMISRAISSEEGLTEGEFGTGKVIDMMQAYYEMSRRTFTDNVINLAIESCLVCDIPDILTPTQVDLMSKERLQEQSLQNEVEILRKGLAQCRRYRPRTVTVLPSSTRGSSAIVRGASADKSSAAAAADGRSALAEDNATLPSVVTAPKAQFKGFLLPPEQPSTQPHSGDSGASTNSVSYAVTPKPTTPKPNTSLFGSEAASPSNNLSISQTIPDQSWPTKANNTVPTSGNGFSEATAPAPTNSKPEASGLFGGDEVEPSEKPSYSGVFGRVSSRSSFGHSSALADKPSPGGLFERAVAAKSNTGGVFSGSTTEKTNNSSPFSALSSPSRFAIRECY
ncbi:hypothetical protein ACHAPJ_010984 [Fusarium lateritium]